MPASAPMSAIGTWNVRKAPSGGTREHPLVELEQLGLIEHEAGGGERPVRRRPTRRPSRIAGAHGCRDTAGRRRPSTGAVKTDTRWSFASAYSRTWSSRPSHSSFDWLKPAACGAAFV